MTLRLGWGACAAMLIGLAFTGRAHACETAADWAVESFDLAAPAFAPEQVHVRVLLPPGYDHGKQRFPVIASFEQHVELVWAATGWTSYEPVVVDRTLRRDHDLLIVHESDCTGLGLPPP